MSNIVTLFEYTSKKFEAGNQDSYDKENDKLILTTETIGELKKMSEKKVIELRWDEIKALNYVGVIKAGDITIEIFPKFLKKGKEDELKKIASKNLLKMLEYTQRWKFKEIDYASLEKVEHDFFEILIYLFAKNLLSLLKVKQNYEYVRKREELRFVKGRIDFARYTNPARLHIIPCIHYERSMDNLINRTLKYTCYLLLKTTKSSENYFMLRRILEILDEVTLSPITLQEVERITFNRLNADFKPFIDICRLILEGSTLTLQASKIETFSLMIPMEKLFEEFIAEMIRMNREIIPENVRGRIYIQKSVGYLATKNSSKYFELIPDIVLEGEEKAIIDTKYKLLNEEERNYGVSQQDIYQMYVYCKETGAKKCLLIYPEAHNGKIESSWELGKDKIKLYVRTVSLEHDLTSENGRRVFIKNLERALECLEEGG